MSQQQPPDAVFLVHGTFAHRGEDVYEPDPHDPGRGPAWWQRNGEFVAGLNELLEGRAECWPDDVCKAMPWARMSMGSRLEGWTIAGMKPMGWLRPRYRIGGRRLFAWSGLNSESERRGAGRRLFQGLRALERENASRIAAGEEPRYYHLIGHSHGGSVIWNALRIAAGRKEPLPHLRSWTTLGTPFPTFRPVRFQWLIGLLGLATIAGAGWLELRGEFARVPRPVEWAEVALTLRAFLHPRSAADGAIEPMVVALREENPAVRQAAARALGSLGTPSACRAAGSLVKALSVPEIRKDVVIALGRIKDLPQEARDSLSEALERGDDDIRADVAAVLATIGTPSDDAGPLLIDLVIFGDRHARQQAVTALEAIGFVNRPVPLDH
ncbi:MAG: HEAT repeat domain-containing protein [Isosphaeraceae bacterium]